MASFVDTRRLGFAVGEVRLFQAASPVPFGYHSAMPWQPRYTITDTLPVTIHRSGEALVEIRASGTMQADVAKDASRRR